MPSKLSHKRRFPTKATCLAIYSRVVNSRSTLADTLKSTFPWCAEWDVELKRLFAAYTQEKQRQNVLDYGDLLLYWAHMVADGELALQIGNRCGGLGEISTRLSATPECARA